jgi:pilus assembly protein Flp/PilA
MLKFFKRLGGDRSGATAIEYGLIAAFIALALTASLPSIRKNLTGVFSSVDTELGQARKAAKN